jgi:DNA polymerase elongation subunit (family B)
MQIYKHGIWFLSDYISFINRKLRMVMSRRHLMKKKKKKSGVRDLLKVLTKASAHIEKHI